MEGDFPLNRYIYEGLSSLPPSLFPNYISAFQSEINGGEGSSSLQLYGGGGGGDGGGGGGNNNYGAYSVFGSHPVTSNPQIRSYNDSDLMEFQRNRLQQSSFINGDYNNNQNLRRSLMVSGSGLDDNVVKMEQQLIPKSELFDVIEPTPLNMVVGEGFSIPNLNSSGGVYHHHHHQLPVLCSLEQIISSQGITNTDNDDGFPLSEPALKRFRSSSSSSSSSSTTRNLVEMPTAIPFLSLNSLFQIPSVIPSSILAREKRKMVSERIRSLEKLMPWNKKMSMANLLEEVYKYIKFLKAQVSVLQAMPCQSSFITTGSSSSSSSSHQQQQQQVMNNNNVGGLENLNRQQLLKVLLNSPVAQTYLYSRGCCVYSLEQLILLKKIAGHRILLQQMLMARFTSSVYSRETLP